MISAETLNGLVTSAIWRSEQLEEKDVEAAARSWLEVSDLEEKLAQVLPPTEGEGRIARRGAVRAALKANDWERASRLTCTYEVEQGAPRSLKESLREMLDEYARQFTNR